MIKIFQIAIFENFSVRVQKIAAFHFFEKLLSLGQNDDFWEPSKYHILQNARTKKKFAGVKLFFT